MTRLLTAILVCATVLLVSGCAGAVHAQGGPSNAIGKTCKIQFKRDILGTHANMPVGPEVDNINGADTAVIGTLLALDIGDQVVLRKADGTELWIPKSNILLMAVQPNPEKN